MMNESLFLRLVVFRLVVHWFGGFRLHELRNLVFCIFRLIDFVEIVHAPCELGGNRSLGSAFLLLEAAFAFLAFRWCRRTEIPFSTACWAFSRSRTLSTEATGTWSAKSATSRPLTAKSARSTRASWTIAPARSRRAAARPARSRTSEPAAARTWPTKPTASSRRSAGSSVIARAGFADGERPPHEQLSVELLNRGLRGLAIGIFHERKPTRAPGLAVERPYDLRGFADGRKVRPQVLFRGLIREIAYEQSNGWHGNRGGGKSAAGPLTGA
jgi:hypothetical protein